MAYEAKEKNFRQIAKVNAKDKLVEAMDMVSIQKVKINIVDWTKGKGESLQEAFAYIDTDTSKVVFGMIATGNLFMKTPISGKTNAWTIFTEQKLKSYQDKDADGRVDMEQISIVRDEGMNIKWQIQIEKGKAIPEETNTGGIKAKSGSFKKDVALKIFMSDIDMAIFANQIVDRIKYRELLETSDAVKEEKRKYLQSKSA